MCIRDSRLQHTSAGLAASLRQFGQGSCPNLWPKLPELKLPILLLTGGEDSKYTALSERMALKLNKARHIKIEGASHAPHFEKPKATAAAINSFMEALA